MSRRKGRSTGKLGLRLALTCGGAAIIGSMLVVVAMGPQDARQWGFGSLVALVVGAVVAVLAWVQGSSIGSRVTDLGLAVSKLNRGTSEVRVRVSGNDEVTALGRAVQFLAGDLAAMAEELEKSGGAQATLDPQVREMRDRTLGEPPAQVEGYEIDGTIAPGSRGGLDYFGSVGNVAYVVSGEGAGPMSVLACRVARDELVRALEQNVSARKALAHTNRVMHKRLARGVCAKASLLEVHPDEIKLYQAGFRSPLWICRAGEVLELSAEGLALGLDEGPVFEKGLRPESIAMQPGVRLVQTNDAGVRSQDLLDLVAAHSKKHTMPFMNLVIGTLEQDSGEGGLREDVLLLTVKRTS